MISPGLPYSSGCARCHQFQSPPASRLAGRRSRLAAPSRREASPSPALPNPSVPACHPPSVISIIFDALALDKVTEYPHIWCRSIGYDDNGPALPPLRSRPDPQAQGRVPHVRRSRRSRPSPRSGLRTTAGKRFARPAAAPTLLHRHPPQVEVPRLRQAVLRDLAGRSSPRARWRLSICSRPSASGANCAKGISALQLSRDLDCQYKTAFVLAHKLREAMALGNDDVTLDGTVEIDGAYFGGHVRPENRKEDRKDRRLAENRDADRRVVVVLRQRGGRTLPFVVRREADGAEIVRQRVALGTELHADEGPHWDALEATYLAHRINHSQAFCGTAPAPIRRKATSPACAAPSPASTTTSQAVPLPVRQRGGMARGSLPHRQRRAAPGGPGGSAGSPVSRAWKGYWQRPA